MISVERIVKEVTLSVLESQLEIERAKLDAFEKGNWPKNNTENTMLLIINHSIFSIEKQIKKLKF